MTIDTTYTLTLPEYLESQQLYIQEKQRFLLYLRWLFVALPFLVSAQPLYLAWKEGDSLNISGIAVSFIPAVIFVFLIPYTQSRAFKKRFTVESPNMTNVRIHLDEQGCRTEVQGFGEGSFQWSAFSLWLEGKSVFILLSGFTFRPIPKSALTLEQQDSLRAFLQQHIPGSKRGS